MNLGVYIKRKFSINVSLTEFPKTLAQRFSNLEKREKRGKRKHISYRIACEVAMLLRSSVPGGARGWAD